MPCLKHARGLGAETMSGWLTAKRTKRSFQARGGQDLAPIDSARTALQRDRVEGSSKTLSERIKREHGRREECAEAVAAPATVSGEPAASKDHWVTGKVRQKAETREPGDLPSTVPGLMLKRGCSGAVSYTHLTLPTTPYV